MKKRNVALILCISILFSIAVHLIPNAFAYEKSAHILLDGKQVSEITIEQNEKEVLTAETQGLDVTSYQWQLLLEPKNSVWVNIYDKTEQECEMSYAVVKNLLDEANSAYIRYAAICGDETVYSDVVCVSVSLIEAESAQVTSFSKAAYTEEKTNPKKSKPVTLGLPKNTEPEYVTITIKYLDISSLTDEEAAIYSPYIATIEKGSDFKQDVVSPTFLGFAPYYDADTTDSDDTINDDAMMIPLDLTNVTENIEIKVYYKPIKVDFAIRYFFQNINDDLYTENVSLYHKSKAETGTIISDDYLNTQAGDTVGFEKMYHIPDSVAADGSTVFECYYDRNYYLFQFDLDDGYGVDPIYARYGTPFVVNTPVKHGYTFKGWDLISIDTDGDGVADSGDGVRDELPAIIPAENRQYMALWENVETTYTIVYWLDKGNGTYSYISSRQEGAISSEEVSGKDDLFEVYEGDNRYYEFVKADENVIVEGDGSTVVNVYYACKEYTLRFYYARSDGTNYYVVGGSTYPFGGYSVSTNENTSVQTLLENVSAWGKVKAVPTVMDEYSDRYKLGEVTYGSYTYYYLEFTEKYGSDLENLWPIGIFNPVMINETHSQCKYEYAYFSAWNGEYKVKYTQDHNSLKGGNETIKGCYMYLDENILFDSQFEDGSLVSFLGFWENGANISWSIPKRYEYNLMVESLEIPGTYELYKKFDTFDDSSVANQTATNIKGLKYIRYDYTVISDGSDGTMQQYSVNFYYDREKYDLRFYDYNEELSSKSEEVAYGASLSDKYFEPDYPSTLEENAYEFGGWYTTPQCYDGSEFDIKNAAMPAYNLILYAKWVPKTHAVNFFTAYDDMISYEAGSSSLVTHKKYDKITHGTVVGSVDSPDRRGLIFAGWFYIENGQKKAFVPMEMPIKRDMNIFADWSSSQPQPYRIQYVLLNDPSVKVADDTNGFAYAGSTRTFTAKAGNPYNQLYKEYNYGFFPTIGSHSITMQYEEDKINPSLNVYTFYYVEAKNIEYTVRYVNNETNTLLENVTVKSTSDVVVTERFKAFENMVPDAFYKRLVISVEWDEEKQEYVGTDDNVITFYYTPNDSSAYYAVHFMLEKQHDSSLTEDEIKEMQTQYNIDGSGGYEETGTHMEGIGDIGSTVSVIPQTFAGFELIDNKRVAISVVGGKQSVVPYTGTHYDITVTEEGTELYIFYKRLEYKYTVHYYLYNTTTPVSEDFPSETGLASYGSTVTKTAADISGYTCVSPQTQTIPIRENEKQNVIIFYYAPVQYVAEYVAVPSGGGRLSNTIEVVTGVETLGGSIPTANQYYEFAGWYMDEACTQSAAGFGEINESTNRFIPDKDKLSETERNIFYAKFIRKSGSLTIDRKDAEDEKQVFVYEVKNNNTGESINVTVVGNDSVTIYELPFGEYTVTQQNDWSWRYDDDSVTVSHQSEDGTTVIFRKTTDTDQWLNGNSDCIRNQRGQEE